MRAAESSPVRGGPTECGSAPDKQTEYLFVLTAEQASLPQDDLTLTGKSGKAMVVELRMPELASGRLSFQVSPIGQPLPAATEMAEASLFIDPTEISVGETVFDTSRDASETPE